MIPGYDQLKSIVS